ncbi:hypothetical protein DFH07DRAFT_945490 [Mycena maculata]|uniref:Uncharacterized protein n=1 Tax=Mycena maculata TaxID=230809 RepID=A0AAD7HYR1_9AGAR|nr:hypothetical protein DFH07DRAFT_945490 [Mycena maculata]
MQVVDPIFEKKKKKKFSALSWSQEESNPRRALALSGSHYISGARSCTSYKVNGRMALSFQLPEQPVHETSYGPGRIRTPAERLHSLATFVLAVLVLVNEPDRCGSQHSKSNPTVKSTRDLRAHAVYEEFSASIQFWKRTKRNPGPFHGPRRSRTPAEHWHSLAAIILAVLAAPADLPPLYWIRTIGRRCLAATANSVAVIAGCPKEQESEDLDGDLRG